MKHARELRDAGAARAAKAAPKDRPSKRRCAPERNAPPVARFGLGTVKMVARSSESNALLDFTGYATVTEQPYEMFDMFGPYTEVVSQAAPAIALQAQPDVQLVLNHGGVPFARTKSGTLALSADATGLAVAATLDPRMPSVQDVRIALERGDLDEMSFKFSITSGQWSPDYTEFRINEFDIDRGDVSIVNYGANPYTSASLRSAALDLAAMPTDQLIGLRADIQLEVEARAPQKPAMSRAALDLLFASN